LGAPKLSGLGGTAWLDHKNVELPGIIMEINDLRKKGRR
jgi:hypothetical protein